MTKSWANSSHRADVCGTLANNGKKWSYSVVCGKSAENSGKYWSYSSKFTLRAPRISLITELFPSICRRKGEFYKIEPLFTANVSPLHVTATFAPSSQPVTLAHQPPPCNRHLSTPPPPPSSPSQKKGAPCCHVAAERSLLVSARLRSFRCYRSFRSLPPPSKKRSALLPRGCRTLLSILPALGHRLARPCGFAPLCCTPAGRQAQQLSMIRASSAVRSGISSRMIYSSGEWA